MHCNDNELNNDFHTEDKKLLLDLICSEQVNMLLENNTSYESERYMRLERLKVMVKDM